MATTSREWRPSLHPAALADTAKALLTHLGIAPTTTRDSVAGHIDRQLETRGHRAVIGELVHGQLRLEAEDPAAAALLRYDTDALLDSINNQHPDAVTRIVVRVQTGREVQYEHPASPSSGTPRHGRPEQP